MAEVFPGLGQIMADENTDEALQALAAIAQAAGCHAGAMQARSIREAGIVITDAVQGYRRTGLAEEGLRRENRSLRGQMRDADRVIAILLHRLGGKVKITAAELADGDVTVRIWTDTDDSLFLEAPALKEYRVSWEVDVDAVSEEDAARKALAMQRDPDSAATVFLAGERGMAAKRVDLGEEDETTWRTPGEMNPDWEGDRQ